MVESNGSWNVYELWGSELPTSSCVSWVQRGFQNRFYRLIQFKLYLGYLKWHGPFFLFSYFQEVHHERLCS